MKRAKPILLAVYLTGLALLLLVAWLDRTPGAGDRKPVFAVLLMACGNE